MNEDFEGILHVTIRYGMSEEMDSEDDRKTLFRIIKYYLPFLSVPELKLIRDDLRYYNLKDYEDWYFLDSSCLYYIGIHTVIPEFSSPDYFDDLDFVTYYSLKYSVKNSHMLDWTYYWIVENLSNLSKDCIEKLIEVIDSNNNYSCEFDKKELEKLEELLLNCGKGKSTIH